MISYLVGISYPSKHYNVDLFQDIVQGKDPQEEAGILDDDWSICWYFD